MVPKAAAPIGIRAEFASLQRRLDEDMRRIAHKVDKHTDCINKLGRDLDVIAPYSHGISTHADRMKLFLVECKQRMDELDTKTASVTSEVNAIKTRSERFFETERLGLRESVDDINRNMAARFNETEAAINAMTSKVIIESGKISKIKGQVDGAVDLIRKQAEAIAERKTEIQLLLTEARRMRDEAEDVHSVNNSREWPTVRAAVQPTLKIPRTKRRPVSGYAGSSHRDREPPHRNLEKDIQSVKSQVVEITGNVGRLETKFLIQAHHFREKGLLDEGTYLLMCKSPQDYSQLDLHALMSHSGGIALRIAKSRSRSASQDSANSHSSARSCPPSLFQHPPGTFCH